MTNSSTSLAVSDYRIMRLENAPFRQSLAIAARSLQRIPVSEANFRKLLRKYLGKTVVRFVESEDYPSSIAFRRELSRFQIEAVRYSSACASGRRVKFVVDQFKQLVLSIISLLDKNSESAIQASIGKIKDILREVVRFLSRIIDRESSQIQGISSDLGKLARTRTAGHGKPFEINKKFGVLQEDIEDNLSMPEVNSQTETSTQCETENSWFNSSVKFLRSSASTVRIIYLSLARSGNAVPVCVFVFLIICFLLTHVGLDSRFATAIAIGLGSVPFAIVALGRLVRQLEMLDHNEAI